MKPLLLRNDATLAVIKGSKSAILIPIKPKHYPPKESDPKADFWSRLKSPYRTGDILFLQEPWQVIDKTIYYMHDWPGSKPSGFRPAKSMTPETARCFLHVNFTDVMCFDDINPELMYEIDPLLKAHEKPDIVLNDFRTHWDENLPQKDWAMYGSHMNPAVFHIQFQKISRKAAMQGRTPHSHIWKEINEDVDWS